MKDKGNFIAPERAIIGIAPAIAIIVVLLSRGKAPDALLFLIGIFSGILMGRGFFALEKAPRKSKILQGSKK